PCTHARWKGGSACRQDASASAAPGHPSIDASSDDVGRELILDEGDAVAQLQLALLQALNLDDIRSGRSLQRRDRSVEITMLLLQAQQLGPKLDFLLLGHRLLGRALGTPRAVAARALGNFESIASAKLHSCQRP